MGFCLRIIAPHCQGLLTAFLPSGPAKSLIYAGCFTFFTTILKYMEISLICEEGRILLPGVSAQTWAWLSQLSSICNSSVLRLLIFLILNFYTVQTPTHGVTFPAPAYTLRDFEATALALITSRNNLTRRLGLTCFASQAKQVLHVP